MISIVLSALFFFSGLLRNIHLGIFMILIVPFSGLYYQYITLKGIYVYDFYFIGLILSLIFIKYKDTIKRSVSIYPVYIIVFYSVITMFNTSFEGTFFRDYRPAILILEVFVLFCFIEKIEPGKIIRIVNIGLVISIIFGIIANVYFIEDRIRSIEIYSYTSISTYVGMIILVLRDKIHKYVQVKSEYYLLLFLSILVVVFSINRTIFLVLILIEMLKLIDLKRLKSSVIVVLIIPLILWVLFSLNIEKLSQLGSIEDIVRYLTIRYEPALLYLDNLDFIEIILGNGFETLFYIPWFVSWGNDPVFNYIDNTYLTLFIKYGFFGLIIVGCFIYDGYRISKSKYIPLLLSVLFITFAFPYQMNAIGLYIGLLIVKVLEIHNKETVYEI